LRTSGDSGRGTATEEAGLVLVRGGAAVRRTWEVPNWRRCRRAEASHRLAPVAAAMAEAEAEAEAHYSVAADTNARRSPATIPTLGGCRP
jgi:hypothetical protein